MNRRAILLLTLTTLALAIVNGTALAEEPHVDQYQTSSDGRVTITHIAYQIFEAGRTGDMDKIALYIGMAEGATPGDLNIRVREERFPFARREVTIPASSFTNDGSLSWVTIPFASPLRVVRGIDYSISLRTPGYVWGNNSADVYSRGYLTNCQPPFWPPGSDIPVTPCGVVGDAAFKTYVPDFTPPTTTIHSGPSGPVNTTSASFSFSSNESGSTFKCSLDSVSDGTWSDCSSPQEYTGLSEGSHRFEVKATDSSGNTENNPPSRTWTVDTIAPSVVGAFPTRDATEVPPTTYISAAFSEAMDMNALFAPGAFALTDQGSSTPIEAWLDYNHNTETAYLTPNSALEANTTYTATVKGGSTGVEDVAGNTLGQDHSWSFTTAPLDTQAPAPPVITGPANNSFDTDGNITLLGTAEAGSTIEVFEESVSKGTTQSDSDGAWSMTLDAVSEGAYAYSAKATDAANNVSGSSNTIMVRVDATKPTVTGTTPINRATNVGRGTNLAATFSEKVKASTVNATTLKLYRINPNGTQTQITDVVVSLSSDGLKATLNPFGTKTTLLARNTKYRGLVTTGTKDLAGNVLAQQRSWTFTTKP